MNNPIYVTQPFLPPLEEVLPYLQEIWSRRVLTNQGPFVREFEETLSTFTSSPHVAAVSNGMLGLQAAVHAADLSGEVITTPYSFVATTHVVALAGLSPVFVDISPSDMNIDADLIEKGITDKTTAILAVHCYGNPCAVDEIETIAKKHDLKVIYDAAHAFGVKRAGIDIFRFGDISITSFHATKVMNTFEGGAVFTDSAMLKRRVDDYRNFGIHSEIEIPEIGSNAKMSEFNAVMGIVQMRYLDEIICQRGQIAQRYKDELSGIDGIRLPPNPSDIHSNHAYFPLRIESAYGLSRDELYDLLKSHQIFSRKYFFPLLSDLPMYRDLPSASRSNLPAAHEAVDTVLCLPIYPGLDRRDQDRIIKIIREKR